MATLTWRAGLVGFAVAAAVSVAAPGTVSSAAPRDAQIRFVNGIDSTPVDVYVDGALIAAGVDYGESGDAELTGGTHTIEVCAAEDPAPDPIPPAGCTASADYPNGGVAITVAGGTSYTVVGQFAGAGATIGRPTIVAYENVVDCSPALRAIQPGFSSFLHAAMAPTVDVRYDDDVVFDEVAPQAPTPPAWGNLNLLTVTVTVQDTEGTELLARDVQLIMAAYRVLVFVGNPSAETSYDLLIVDYELPNCPTPPPPTDPTTTTTVPSAVVPVVVDPRFTG